MSLLGKHTSPASSALHCFVGALFHVGHDNLIANFLHLMFSRQLLNVTVISCYLFYHESHGIIFFLILVQLLELEYLVLISSFIKKMIFINNSKHPVSAKVHWSLSKDMLMSPSCSSSTAQGAEGGQELKMLFSHRFLLHFYCCLISVSW